MEQEKGTQSYFIDVLDQQGLALLVDLSNLFDLALVPTANNANSISGCEEDVLSAEVFRNARWVHQGRIKGTIGRGFQSCITLRSQISLLPVLPAGVSSSLEVVDHGPVVFLSCPNCVLAIHQFLLLPGPEELLLGLLPGRSRPLDDLLHVERVRASNG